MEFVFLDSDGANSQIEFFVLCVWFWSLDYILSARILVTLVTLSYHIYPADSYKDRLLTAFIEYQIQDFDEVNFQLQGVWGWLWGFLCGGMVTMVKNYTSVAYL